MARILKEEQIINVIWGATLLGGGGGGSMQSGLDMLERYKKDHPDKAPTVNLMEYNEMKDGEFAAVTAGMGAPSAIVGVDFTPYAVNAFKALQELAKRMGKDLKYSIPVEMGGFNTFVPMLISMETDLPFIDADGSGRAVPALETLLLNVNGCDTSPLTMANDKNDKITIELADPKNAKLAEKLGRDVCIEFEMKAGLCGWMIDKHDVEKRIVDGSITLAEKIGDVFRKETDKKNLFEALIKANLIDAKVVCKGKVIEAVTDPVAGFDKGYVIVEGQEGAFRIDFQNENLLISSKKGDTLIPIMTVPDIICMYDMASGMPLTNADVVKGMEVAVGIMQVNKKWFITNGTWWNVWNDYMDGIGYKGKNLPYNNVNL